MDLKDLKSSRYLKKEDVGEGMVVTISGLEKENVALDGAEESIKAVLHFKELDKPMVLNSTNGQAIAKITGIAENIDTGWMGKKIFLYNDPNVSFSGKLTGGIRARAVKKGDEPDVTGKDGSEVPF